MVCVTTAVHAEGYVKFRRNQNMLSSLHGSFKHAAIFYKFPQTTSQLHAHSTISSFTFLENEAKTLFNMFWPNLFQVNCLVCIHSSICHVCYSE